MCGGGVREKNKMHGGGALAQKIKCGGFQAKKYDVGRRPRKNKMYGGVSAKK